MGPQWNMINIRRDVETTGDAACVEAPKHVNTLQKLKQTRLKYANMSSYIDLWILESRKQPLHLNL
jgi:hypothetical protein